MSASVCLILLLIGVEGSFAQKIGLLDLPDKEWWENALVYQIWPRGFQDSDGDGEGDLKGIIDRLDYVKDLGVDTIRINPIYSSPLVDSGYDISNYTDINPLFGTIEHFDQLLDEAHERDLKVILDIVPNHSSDQHEWFYLSTQNVEPYNDYYIWSDGNVTENGTNLPPNNWLSFCSNDAGSAWTWHNEKQQWYYHKFHSSQPDLNLRNENVIQELLSIFEFWLKRGVDGFHINAVPYFFEDEDLQDESFTGNNSYTFGLPESTSLLYTFRAYIDKWVEINNSTSKLLIAESYDSDENLISYYGNETHDGIPPSNFRFITHIRNNSNAEDIKRILEEWFEKLPNNTSTNWMLSNHDHSRAASRIGLNRVDGLHMLNLLLPGQAYTYYGDEIAMLDVDILWGETLDLMGCTATNETYKESSRDPSRTPMQWDSTTSAGFSINKNTYLPVHFNYPDRNVEKQLNQSRSNLNVYKELTALRKEPIFVHGNYEITTLNDNHVLVLKRSLEGYPVYLVVTNLGLRSENVNLTSLYPDLEDTLEVIVASSNAVNIAGNVSRDGFILTANAAVVLKGEEMTKITTETMSSTESAEKGSSSTSTTESNVTETGTAISEEISSTDSSTVSPIESTTSSTTEPADKKRNNAVINSGSVLQLIISTTITVIVLFKF